jgi:hypothetical protein
VVSVVKLSKSVMTWTRSGAVAELVKVSVVFSVMVRFPTAARTGGVLEVVALATFE